VSAPLGFACWYRLTLAADPIGERVSETRAASLLAALREAAPALSADREKNNSTLTRLLSPFECAALRSDLFLARSSGRLPRASRRSAELQLFLRSPAGESATLRTTRTACITFLAPIRGLNGSPSCGLPHFTLQRLQALSLPAVEFISFRVLSRSAEHEARDACGFRGGQSRSVSNFDLLCNSS